MIDGRKKKTHTSIGLRTSEIHMFLKRAVIFLCLVLIDIHHEGAGKSVVASVKGPKKAYRRIL